jgi:uncharacterized protein YtpQ (UPF0354 family)
MTPNILKTFVHPHSVYRLEYPAHWDQLTEKDGASCGFGPHDRDDVGLWLSIMPVSVDTDRLTDDLPKLMEQALGKSDAANLREDPTLRHFGLVADIVKEGQGGHYWIVAGGDVVLFASTQVPAGERDVWNPPFLQLMASLQITRDRQQLEAKVANDVMAELRRQHPDQEFTFEEGNIRGPNSVVYLSNVCREVQAAPKRRAQIIKQFVTNLNHPDTKDIGYEEWDDVQNRILPVLKPANYINPDGPTKHLLTSEWLSDVLICYVIKSEKMFRFVTGWDVNRWGTDAQALHQRAVSNLAALPWPRQLVGARTKSGRVIVVETDDAMASSRLLHPELHKLFSGPLGSPFWAGIPCRERLVLFSDRRALKARITRKVSKDHDTAAYPITPLSFLVTRDGIAPGDKP